jgi:phosphodiesterase/alkaline phosphatase D-like protein
MCGDQVYADGVEKELLAEPDFRKRQQLYLSIYHSMWSDPVYRKVLCSLPSILMWDDHDITDGWGSREDSFKDGKSPDFTSAWDGLFEAARSVFRRMQAIRNPSFDSPNAFDTCFRIGRAAFVVPDLRSNRNVRKHQIWSADQFNRVRAWVESVRQESDTVFFVSSVVFSHGDPKIEASTVMFWPLVLRFVGWLHGLVTKWNALNSAIRSAVSSFDSDCGDLRDDINDSWGAEANAEETDCVLDWLFSLQNPGDERRPLNVVILSGDIHTPGYSTIYSSTPELARPSIPHIVSTPVAYQPFSWFMEAVYRHLTKAVKIGKKDVYTAQVSHHFCHRTVVLLSLRSVSDERQLKVKYYLEGFPEPQILLFDLGRASHKENIQWNAPGEGQQQSPVPA